MKICVGLGNPGKQYARSRHNTGFAAVETLRQRMMLPPWSLDRSAQALISIDEDTILVLPQTFMNLSGTALLAVLKKNAYGNLAKKDFANLLVVYDDLDIEIGKYKLVYGSGPKAHNGVNNILEILTSDQFWHLRIGIDGRYGDRSIDPQDYVLQVFPSEEQAQVDSVIDSAADVALQQFFGRSVTR